MNAKIAQTLVHPLSHMTALQNIAIDMNSLQSTQGAGGQTLTNALIPFIDKHSLTFNDYPEYLSGSIMFPGTKNGYEKVIAAARQSADELEKAEFHYKWQPNHNHGLGNRMKAAYDNRLKTVATLKTIADRLEISSQDPERWKRQNWIE